MCSFYIGPKYIEEIKDFCIDREANVSCIHDSVIGLESYLKRLAWYDDMDGQVKIYLIRGAYKKEDYAAMNWTWHKMNAI